MTLDNYMFKSIYLYPRLYYYRDLDSSRIAVLNQLFLTLGNGMSFSNGVMRDHFFKLKSYDIKNSVKLKIAEIKKRIKCGETIISVSEKKNFQILAQGFESDIGYCNKNSKYIVKKFPEENEKNFKLYGGKGRSPYPFCFYYLPFVQINPHYSKYTYHTIREMTVEELRESIPLIKKDWLKGIVEVYKWALDFYDSQAFLEDQYYNWIISANFKEWVDRFESNPNRLNDYQIPLNMQNKTAMEIATYLIDQNRQKYISDCKKIIAAFEEKT